MQVHYATDQVDKLQKRHLRYVVVVYYRPFRLYYKAIPPAVVAYYLPERVSLVMDNNVSYCSRRHRKVSVFDVNESLDAGTDEDGATANEAIRSRSH